MLIFIFSWGYFTYFQLHFSTNLSTNHFLHLQFSQSKYSQTSHGLSHSHSQLLGFQINPISHTSLSIIFLHSHLHLSSFQSCLLLQTLILYLHLHLHVSCHSMHLVSLVPDTRLSTLTFTFFTMSRTHNFACGLLILLELPLHLFVLILKGKYTGSSPLTSSFFLQSICILILVLGLYQE